MAQTYLGLPRSEPARAATPAGRLTVRLVQQGVWDMPLESMPLASGYLKSTALADPVVRDGADIQIFNYRGGAGVTHALMANELFGDGAPDVLACSVLGWNYRTFGSLIETFKAMNPDGWAIVGGTHVANQGDRVFRMFPDVDIVVNGEGELVFRDLLRARLDGRSPRQLADVTGVSFTDERGSVVTTAPRERIEDLDVIPSPFLTGAIDLTDADGNFRYDVALLETNRGCPYKCSFCYWGGAVGQRVRAFSRDRLRQELRLFAELKVHTVVACDANFGMLPIDQEFIQDLIAVRDEYGFPRALETSWAKNKSKVFYDIVSMMKQAGMRSSFTLALQTLNGAALDTMNRRNMKVNDWEDLVEWLGKEGLDCYAELIWGAPGETVESFMAGYDRLARRVSRIAVYPILLLPNTEYSEKRDEYGIVAVRGDDDDFEYVLSHDTMTFAENRRMQRFLFWARVVAENAVLRYVWSGLQAMAGMSQSQVLSNLDAWIEHTDDPAAVPLRSALMSAIGGTDAFGAAISYLYVRPEAKRLLERWWAESIRPLLPAEPVPLLDEIFRYDILTQPVYRPADTPAGPDDLPVTTVRGQEYHVRSGVRLAYDVPAVFAALRRDEQPDLTPSPVVLDLYYRVGSDSAVTSTNHEVVVHFMGLTRDEVLRQAAGDGDTADAAAALLDRGGCA